MNDETRKALVEVIEAELDSYCPSPFNGAFAVSLMQIIDRLLTTRPEPAADAVEAVVDGVQRGRPRVVFEEADAVEPEPDADAAIAAFEAALLQPDVVEAAAQAKYQFTDEGWAKAPPHQREYAMYEVRSHVQASIAAMRGMEGEE